MKIGDLVQPTLAASPHWWDTGLVTQLYHHIDGRRAIVLWSDYSQSNPLIRNLEVIHG